MPQQFILGDSLSDDQLLELVEHSTVDIDGFLYSEWRKDAEGQMWLKRIAAEIHGVEPDVDICADGFVDAPDDDDDDDNPIAMTWIYGSDRDDE